MDQWTSGSRMVCAPVSKCSRAVGDQGGMQLEEYLDDCKRRYSARISD